MQFEDRPNLVDGRQNVPVICLLTKPELFEQVLTKEQLLAIYTYVGRKQLMQLASVVHGNEPDCEYQPVYQALAEQEKKDLEILFCAIRQVTGNSKLWIIGFASDFARGLMAYTDAQ